jgi:hypothetical protein
MNLRKVRTSVTVNDVHSVVSTNTELIQTYWVSVFPIKYNHKMGIVKYTKSTNSNMNKCLSIIMK